MIRFKSNSLLIPLLVALFCAGASSCRHLIFEDRTDCPAFLLFDLTNGDELDVSEYAFVTAYQYPDNNLLASDTTTVKSIQNKEFYLKVKHTDTAIGYGVLRFNGAHNEGSCWTVAPGKDFPPIWRFNYRSPAATESYIIPVEAVKDHSVMTVRFTDPDFFDGTGGEFPFFIIARSNTCGIDGMDGTPVKGEFHFAPAEFAAGAFRFTIPRQYDRSLHLEVWGREGLREESRMVTDIALWNLLMMQENFSWTAKNLADIEIEISLVEKSYRIIIVEWNDATYAEYYN